MADTTFYIIRMLPQGVGPLKWVLIDIVPMNEDPYTFMRQYNKLINYTHSFTPSADNASVCYDKPWASMQNG